MRLKKSRTDLSMTTQLESKKLALQSEYVFARIKNAIKQELSSNSKPMLDFSVGVPDYPTNDKVVAAYVNAVRRSRLSNYPGFNATKEFSDALENWYKYRYDVDLEFNSILVLNGAKEGIAHTPLALFNPNDTVLVPNPGYPAYSAPSLFAGANVVPYDLTPESDFKIDYNQLDRLLHFKPRYMWVNFPSNPTGQMLSQSELTVLVAYALKHDIFILYDNAYSEIFFENNPPPSILQVEGSDRCAVEFGSVSKSFSLAGLRLGWVCGNNEAVSAIAKLKTIYDSGVSQVVQSVGAAAFNLRDEIWHRDMIQSYQDRRTILKDHLPKLGLSFSLPPSSLYIWAKIPDNETDSESFCTKILKQYHIVFAPGSAFGTKSERYVRISVGVNVDYFDRYIS
jgi:LL-diaminopimelate aminotransferase